MLPTDDFRTQQDNMEVKQLKQTLIRHLENILVDHQEYYEIPTNADSREDCEILRNVDSQEDYELPMNVKMGKRTGTRVNKNKNNNNNNNNNNNDNNDNNDNNYDRTILQHKKYVRFEMDENPIHTQLLQNSEHNETYLLHTVSASNFGYTVVMNMVKNSAQQIYYGQWSKLKSELFSQNYWPEHMHTGAHKHYEDYYKSMPEEFYSTTQLPVVKPAVLIE